MDKDASGSLLSQGKVSHTVGSLFQTSLGEPERKPGGKKKTLTGNFSACFYPPSPKTTARSPRESSDHGVKATKADHFPMCGGRAAREPWEAEPGSIRNPWPWLSRPTSEEHEATPTAALPSPLAAAKNQIHPRREPHQGQLPGAGKVSLGSQVLFNYLSNIPN